jgi:hypothetical protein
VIIVHCFRCDDVVEVSTDGEGPLWCTTCEDDVLGPPSDTGDRSVRWSPSGLLLAGQVEEPPAHWRPRRSRGGSIMGAAMLGMYQAIYGPVDDEPAIEVVDDEPDGDANLELHLDREVRSRSWIRFKR